MDASLALLELGRALRRLEYRFVTVTPETHARVQRRAFAFDRPQARDLRDVFGWNRSFEAALLPSSLLALMQAAGVLMHDENGLRSSVRFSTLDDLLLVHSAFPTNTVDSVFFGPDSYRFCALLERWMPRCARVVDVGCGSGVGGLWAARRARRVVLADVAPRALELTRINAQLNGVEAEVVASDVLAGVAGPIDVVIANPPYMRDPSGRLYRDGGGARGEGLALRIVDEALGGLSAGGTLILYTGSAIVAGGDTVLGAIAPLLHARHLAFHYEELDPDVFGEELDQPAYRDVERIAAVGLRVTTP